MLLQSQINVVSSFSQLDRLMGIAYTTPEEEIRPSKSDRQLSHRRDRRNTAAELKVWEVVSS